MYDYPFETFVGRYAFSYCHDLPSEVLALFNESDRTGPTASQTDGSDSNDDEESVRHTYVVPVQVMRERLEIMGFSNAHWQTELQEFVDEQIKHGQWQVDRTDPGTGERKRAEKRLMILRQSSLRRWMRKLMSLLNRCWDQSYAASEDTLEYAMFDRHTMMPEPIFTRELILLRGALEILEDDDEVVFDFSNAVYQDVTSSGERLSEIARDRLLRPVREFDPVLVLTEGRTDAKIIRESFRRMKPEVAHMFSYMEHESFKAEGGTSALVSLARSLAAARISNRIIFLFDNDTAGHEGLHRFLKEGFPSHYQGMTLPYLKSAETYPTIGPTGEAEANVNGCACGIELYCGPKALTKEDGSPCRVQWTGYVAGMKRYQGEPLDKDGIKKRFLSTLQESIAPETDPEFEEMRLVLNALTKVRWN